jgi:hypothetical protein
MPAFTWAERHKGLWPAIALSLICPPAAAGDPDALLGKTIDAVAEVKVTKGKGTAVKSSLEQSIRKFRFTRDGNVFVTTKTGPEGEIGYIYRLNQEVDMASHPEGLSPEFLKNFSISTYVVKLSYDNALLTQSVNGIMIYKRDHSRCMGNGLVTIGFSPDLTVCWVRSSDTAISCGPPGHQYLHREVTRSLSCAVN